MSTLPEDHRQYRQNPGLLPFLLNTNHISSVISQSVFDGVGKCLDCVFATNTCISSNIHAEIKNIPPIGVIIPTLIFASVSK